MASSRALKIRPSPPPSKIFPSQSLTLAPPACRRLGLAVPDEVAVIGVDNDELLCELSDPPLTSVIPNMHRTGYEAAALLDQMIAGKTARGETHLIPPLGIATRQSTDVLVIE